MSNRTLIYFTTRVINNSKIVTTTKVDSTIKAIIKNFSKNIDIDTSILIDYLNTIRVVYYLKRLKYYNYTLFKETTSKLPLKYKK